MEEQKSKTSEQEQWAELIEAAEQIDETYGWTPLEKEIFLKILRLETSEAEKEDLPEREKDR